MKRYFSDLDYSLSQLFTPVLKWVIYICCGVFLMQLFYKPLALVLGASVYWTFLKFHLWQLVTYAFAHGGFMHLFFNLLAFYFFGKRLEQRWGSETFLKFVIFVAAGAVSTHLAATAIVALTGRPVFLGVPIIGLSGVVYGVMLVYAMYYPNDTVLFYGIIPIKIKHLVLILGLMTFFASTEGSSGVAHLTHLGGLLFGYLFYRFPAVFDRIPLPSFRRRRRGPEKVTRYGGWDD